MFPSGVILGPLVVLSGARALMRPRVVLSGARAAVILGAVHIGPSGAAKGPVRAIQCNAAIHAESTKSRASTRITQTTGN
eukprot:9476403-Pyramimonas_sp.AAC.1